MMDAAPQDQEQQLDQEDELELEEKRIVVVRPVPLPQEVSLFGTYPCFPASSTCHGLD